MVGLTHGGEVEKTLKAESYSVAEMATYLEHLFRVGDSNGDGLLSTAELGKLLQMSGFSFDEAKVSEVLDAADTSGDGLLDPGEFVLMMLEMMRSEDDGKDGKKGK